MNKIVEKTKDLLIGKQTPITKEAASMLTLAGKVCTIEERISEFIKGINDTIINKARSSQFMVLVETPEELLSKISTIQKDFSDRGFTIHTLAPEIKGVFIIDWK
jgi:uncharacterized protein YoxC